MFSILRRTVFQFSEDDCVTMAASLAYYTLFAMPPLLFLLALIVSLGMSTAYEQSDAEVKAEKFLQQQAAQLIGNKAASQEIGNIIRETKQQSGTWWKSALSLIGVLIGATGLVTALQAALNRVWRVKPSGAFAMRFVAKRLISLTLILGFGFLLLVSFVVSTVLNMLGDLAADQFGFDGLMPMVINQSVSFGTTWVFFVAIFRIMPDAQVRWTDAMLGGLFTVTMFTLGRVVLFYYLSMSNPAQQLGSAAASLVVILVWVYYSSLILLFGAEFTANITVEKAAPEEGAVNVLIETSE